MSFLSQPPFSFASNLSISSSQSPLCLKKTLKVGVPAENLYKIFRKNGFFCFVVGGFVRNALLGGETTDLDLATDATPEQMLKMFPKAIPTGIAHGTLTILLDGQSFEVTTFRAESTYSDARHPDCVFFSKSLEQDIIRRDFTVNALAYDIGRREIIDYVGGLKDLQQKKLRAIGGAEQRFREDALRMMRICRFVSQLGFSVDSLTSDALQQNHDLIRCIANERIQAELSKLLLGQNPFAGLEMMRHSGLLSIILPELHETIGFEQNSFHAFDVYTHTLHVVSRCAAEFAGEPKMLLSITLAALFHDVGKVQTRAFSPQTKDFTFYGHERVSAELAQKRLKILRYPQNVIRNVVHMINHHMIQYQENWTDAAVRRFIRRIGTKMLPPLFSLARADRYGKSAEKNSDDESDLLVLGERISQELKKPHVFSMGDLNVDGHDIMVALSIQPGCIVGKILKELLEFILDNPQQNQKERLLQQAKIIFVKRYKDYE